jgi:hypothetical protein
MFNTAPKRFILPFSQNKIGEPFSRETELATVYALAELERSKGGGLVVRQPKEELIFMAEAGYPLWLFPSREFACIFDGLNGFAFTMSYVELPAAKTFMESLENHSKTLEDYTAFLLDHQSFFEQPKKDKHVTLKGLIVDLDFQKEFIVYRKEAVETAVSANLALLSPTLEESAIVSTLAELDRLQLFFKEDAEKLSECLRFINKTTNQYITELGYAAEAVKGEANAKIKAQEEIINPQIAKLNSEYKHKITNLTKSFDEELESLKKQKNKTEKSIESLEEKIKLYEHEAQTQARKKHQIYEKRWKEKSGKTKKETGGLKKDLKRVEKNIQILGKQKVAELSKLSMKLEAEIKLMRQPLFDLEIDRDSKMLVFKQKSDKLVKQEKAVTEELYGAIKMAQTVNAKFEALGIRDQQLKSPALFYVTFYVVCYQAGLSRRYIFLPPSMTSELGFSAKFKGAFGISKIKEAFAPRFKAITGLIERCQVLAKQDTSFESEIGKAGEKNNLLNIDLARANIAKGLVYLKHEGRLSDKEYGVLKDSLARF